MVEKLLYIGRGQRLQEGLAVELAEVGFESATAEECEAGFILADEMNPAIILCESGLPDGDGVSVVERCGRTHALVPVVVLVPHDSTDAAVRAFRRGASDVLVDPVAPEEVAARCRQALAAPQAMLRRRRFRRTINAAESPHGMIGVGAAMQEVFRLIASVASTRSNVLVTGESGTGKDRVARAVHQASEMCRGPFLPVSSAALAPELLESELFGHCKGAFTGATSDRTGYFESASGGTLFLDEISEMPLSLQPKLLRVLQEKTVVRVGGTRSIRIDLRLISATSRDLHAECAARRFREDLFYRLCVVDIHLPPLRERTEDIPALAEAAVARLSHDLGKTCLGIDRAAIRRLLAYHWPGNIRELENAIERAIIVAQKDVLGERDLPQELLEETTSPQTPIGLESAIQSFETAHIRRVLQEADGNRKEAARRLRIDCSTLSRKLRAMEDAEVRRPRGAGAR